MSEFMFPYTPHEPEIVRLCCIRFSFEELHLFEGQWKETTWKKRTWLSFHRSSIHSCERMILSRGKQKERERERERADNAPGNRKILELSPKQKSAFWLSRNCLGPCGSTQDSTLPKRISEGDSRKGIRDGWMDCCMKKKDIIKGFYGQEWKNEFAKRRLTVMKEILLAPLRYAVTKDYQLILISTFTLYNNPRSTWASL